jgi:hypothetical protein
MESNENQLLGLSWPLRYQSNHFDLGHILNCAVAEAIAPVETGALASQHAGLWECDLSTGSLIWSGGVYDMFGLERGVPVSRELALAHYTEDSRAKLERLRTHAFRNKLGFTIEVEIRAAAVGTPRRLRIIGAPVYEGDVAVRLHGLKLVL